jgi:hypothetical protein
MRKASFIAPVMLAGAFVFSGIAVAQEAPVAAPTPSAAAVRIPEGTEFRLRLEDKVSSTTSSSGEKFRVTVTRPTTLADGTVIPAGYRGVGEVVDAQKSGALGSGGGLSVKLNYISIGETRVRLRGAQAVNGKSSEATTFALSLLTGVGGIFVHGHDVELDPGQDLLAFVDEDVSVPLPLPPPS